MEFLFLVSVFVIATCGLVYELIAGTLASYLLGDSVTQFSTIIGCYLFAMGIGSWLSRYVEKNLIGFFVKVEILLGAIGGSSACLLFLMFEHVQTFRPLLYFIVTLTGILVGIEIPLLLRILKNKFEFKDLVSKVFTFDYAGALLASVLFPLVMVRYLGLVKTSFLFGMMNVAVALWLLYFIKEALPAIRYYKISAILVMIALMFGFVYSESLVSIAENNSYQGKIIFAESTPHQRIVLTRTEQDLRLFLNANLQFSSVDEYRYHEALVHPALASLDSPRRVLVIGGGDGLAVREILKYPSVATVTVVDLDPRMTELFSTNELLTALNWRALLSPKVTVVNQDAFAWLREIADTPEKPQFDAVIMDVPDPSNYSVGKLYSLTFFRLLHNVIGAHSIVVVQSTSPLIARKSYWCVNQTLEAAGFTTTPYHAFVPSFGEWGYIIGKPAGTPYMPPLRYPDNLRYLSTATALHMFHFPADMDKISTKIQRLDDQILVRYFEDEWAAHLIY